MLFPSKPIQLAELTGSVILFNEFNIAAAATSGGAKGIRRAVASDASVFTPVEKDLDSRLRSTLSSRAC